MRGETGSSAIAGRQTVLARHHVEQSGLAGIFEAAFLMSPRDVCFDLGLRLAVGAQFFLPQANHQNGAAAFRIEAPRLDRRFRGLYEMPANKAAKPVRAFASFLMPFG